MPLPIASHRAAARVVIVAGVIAALVLSMLAGVAAAEPSKRQLQEQRARAARLAELAGARVGQTVDAKDRLSLLAAAAGQALDAYVTAQRQAQEARAPAATERARYLEASRIAATERVSLGRFAASAYRNGGSMGDMTVLAALLDSDNLTDLGRSAADLRYAGSRASQVLDRLVTAKAQAAEAAAAADAAKRRAVAAERRQEAAKQRADSLVDRQRVLVRSLERKAAQARGAAQRAENRAAKMAEARRIAAERRREAERRRLEALRRGEVVQVTGDCAGGDVSAYANGQIPRSALCPLWGAEWHVLRADAAAAFSAMSKAYAAQFGRPILVTDSYRSYEMQVACYEEKGSLCATPGTSNHGWGTAVDLGDGVNSFYTSTHQWMKDNAPRFGWFLPSWAGPSGSKPEPWHWEFAG